MSTGIGCRASVIPALGGVKGEPGMNLPIDSNESDTRPTTTPAEVSETSGGRSDRWAVVIFNDKHHSMDYVIWALLTTLPELSETDAALIMLEAHNTGKGVVAVCGRAEAEGYLASLRIRQLDCEIQPGW